MEISLIRHFKTSGNIEKRYIGRTDESLADYSHKISESYPKVQTVFSSPMKRCIETSKLIYPNFSPTLIDELKEIDFGEFEGKTYEELKDFPSYKAFLEDGDMAIIPSGESRFDFKKRSVFAFWNIVEHSRDKKLEKIAIICHGGTIMSILSELDENMKDFYSFMVSNGEGYTISLDDKSLKVAKISKISIL